MTDTNRCPICGTERPANAPDGLCPRCLMQQAMAGEIPGTSSDETVDWPAAIDSTATPNSDTDLVDRTGDWSPDADRTTDAHGDSRGLPRGTTIRYFGDYELQKELGRGGMGVVYKALQISLNRPVALKMIKAGVLADDTELQRFQNEAEAVALLDHAGIVPVYEVGEHEGQRYFSMKLVEGGNLAEQLPTFKTNPRAAATLMAEAAEAVHHAHMRGILHRDLKPANILVDAEGHPHVTDFGLAKRVEGDIEMTATGAILGTPAYMSPEQANGRRGSITTATDVYGLGAILYALLTGKAPFGGDSVIETLDAVRTRPPESPRKFNPDTPRDLETICLRCLEKDPRRRYASAHELAVDLTNWLDSRPITARRVGTAERAWLWCKRKPAVAGLAAAVVLAVVGGTAGIFVVQARANSNLRSANGKLDRANTELKSSNIALDKQRARAETGETQAVDAVKKFRDAVVNNGELKNNASLESLRKTLLKEPLAFFQALRKRLQDDGDTKPESLVRLNNAITELGAISAEIGDKRDALAAYREAMPIAQKLLHDHPTNTGYLWGLARIQYEIGDLLYELGKLAEGLKATESARANFRKLVAAEPTRTDFQVQLSSCHANIGRQLEYADPTRSLEAHESALAILQKLADADPSSGHFQNCLAIGYGNIGRLLLQTGKPAESMKAFKAALAIHQKLAAANPAVTSYRSGLAQDHYNLGLVLEKDRRPLEALKSYESARGVQQKLVDENPTVTAFQSELEISLSNIGSAYWDLGKRTEALKAHESNYAILQKLVQAHPESPGFASSMGGTLHNLMLFDAEAGRLPEARDRLLKAIGLQRKALASNPANPFFRQFLSNHLTALVWVANRLGRPAEAAEAQRALDLMRSGDIRLDALNERLHILLKADPPDPNIDRLTRARQAHDKERHAAAARLWADALKADPKLASDRQAGHRYNAACDAAMAGSGQGKDDPRPDEAARTKLREQALGWLKAELSAWKRVAMIVEPGNKELVAKTLAHWKQDADLASLRNTQELAKLPEAERKEWQSLWADVDILFRRTQGLKS